MVCGGGGASPCAEKFSFTQLQPSPMQEEGEKKETKSRLEVWSCPQIAPIGLAPSRAQPMQ